jgi:monofunctional biosynthetic peptidoglycan transglycosylase
MKESRRGGARGASTITMQTVKNVFLWPGRSYVRKAIEMVMAPIAGTVWGKRRTLELYLNVIEWGDGIYGIAAAARHHFGRPPSALTEYQAAALASILPNPRKLSPKALSAGSRARLSRVLKEARGTRVP